jgi:hypothetical protein
LSRAPVTGGDEITRVERAFNSMAVERYLETLPMREA